MVRGGFVVGVGLAVVVVVGFTVVVVVGLVVVVVVDAVVVVGRVVVVVGAAVVVVGRAVVVVVGPALPLGDDTVKTAAPGIRLSPGIVVDVDMPGVVWAGACRTGLSALVVEFTGTPGNVVNVVDGSATPAICAMIGAATAGTVEAERGSSTIGASAFAPAPLVCRSAVVDGDRARLAGSAGGDFDEDIAISPPRAPPARRSARGAFCMEQG